MSFDQAEPMRIAQVVRPARGGIRRHVSLLLAHLDPARFRCVLFAPADFTLDDSASVLHVGDDAPSLPVPRVTLDIAARVNPLADLRAGQQLAQQTRGNFDLLHAHGLHAALPAALATQRTRLPFLFTAHNLVPPTGSASRLILRWIARRAVRIIAVSSAVAASLEALGVTSEKVIVLPNGVDVAAFDKPLDTDKLRAQFDIAANAPLIVGVGRLSPEKGFDILLAAFAQIHSQFPAARLALVGSGALDNSLRAQASVSNLPVAFAGQVESAADWLRAADIVAIPSRAEGQGIVALEAMAARRPVVASKVGGLPESVLQEETGLLTPPESVAALAKALALLLAAPERRRAMGEAGRRRVEQNYRLADQVARTAALYAALHKTNRTSPLP